MCKIGAHNCLQIIFIYIKEFVSDNKMKNKNTTLSEQLQLIKSWKELKIDTPTTHINGRLYYGLSIGASIKISCGIKVVLRLQISNLS
jgi:hypothetical protein